MDKLNQAFMKAYSKQQRSDQPRRTLTIATKSTPLGQSSSHATEVSSTALPDHGTGTKRWRVDIPVCSADGQTVRAAHFHVGFAPVEHVESYSLDEICGPQPGRVVLEDRIAPQELFESVRHDKNEEPEEAEKPEGGIDESARSALADSCVPDQDAPDQETLSEDSSNQGRHEAEPGEQQASVDKVLPPDWIFELNVQLIDDALDIDLAQPPIVAVQTPSQLDDTQCAGVFTTRPWMIDPQPDHATCDSAPMLLEESQSGRDNCLQAPSFERTAVADPSALADSADSVTEEPEVSLPGVPSTPDGSVQPEPSRHQFDAVLDSVAESEDDRGGNQRNLAAEELTPFDASSPEQLDCSARKMDEAPSVPLPEPEWSPNNEMTCSTIAMIEPATRPFAPAWEVDRFHWPDLCVALEQAADTPLTEAGEALREATCDDLRVVAITSAQRREGRTTLALALARSAARAGARVALLDTDLENPNLARQLGIEAPCNWSDTMARREPLSEAAVQSLEDNITLFPLTGPLDNLRSGLADERLASILHQAREEFDLVILDMHPVTHRDASLFQDFPSCPIDMAIVVRNTHVTPTEETLTAVAHLQTMGVTAIGIAENFTTTES